MLGRHRASTSTAATTRPPVRSDVDPVRRRNFRVFSAVVLSCGIAASSLVALWSTASYGTELLLVGPALVTGFLLAERLTIDVDVRRVGWTISFTEIPLLLGMLTAPFEVVLGANLLAGLVAHVGRRAASHVVYNAGVLLLETALPFALAHAVNVALLGFVPGWFGPVVGTLTSSLISCGCALAAVYVLGGPMRASGGMRLAVRTLAVGLFNTSVGLVGYEVTRSTAWGWLLVTLVAVAVAGLYRAYSGLLREHRDLETLSDVSLSVARSGRTAQFPGADTATARSGEECAPGTGGSAEWAPMAERIRDQLNAKRVVLRLLTESGGSGAESTTLRGTDVAEPSVPGGTAGMAGPDGGAVSSRSVVDWPEPSARDAEPVSQTADRGPTSTRDRCVIVAGEPLPADVRLGDASDDDPLSQLPGTHVRSYRTMDAPEEVHRALTERDAYEALVVPLRCANHLLGTVEVHDRLSRWRGFGRADVRLLHTLASHLATALDNRRLLARLRHDAYHDPLTGLLNRTGFRQVAGGPGHRDTRSAAGSADAGGRARERPSGVVLRVDLDVLTTVSEALGYVWGDRLVVAASERLRTHLGAAPLARLEADSFAVLLDGYSVAEAHEYAHQLRTELAEPYALDRIVVEAHAVVGHVSTDPVDGEPAADADTLLQRADVALRAARNGEEGVRAYAPAMGQVFLRRFQLVTQFRHALDSGQVEVHYQPKVALPHRQVVGAEALVRWFHPEYGRINPDEFVPVIEAAGLVDALTTFVLECSLRKVREWLDQGLRMSIAVNLSVRNLADASFPERVAESLHRHAVPAELLTFELTESSVMADPERSLPVLRQLHALGVVLAVDDFGTGYSALAYLRRLPVDEVKIDKSFVLGMGTDLADMAVVRSIVELGHSLHLAVVAEGVEDDAAREQLIDMGADVAQGYLISRPLSECRFEAWLRARTRLGSGAGTAAVRTLLPGSGG